MKKTVKKDSSKQNRESSIVGTYVNKNTKTLHRIFHDKSQLSMEHLTGINQGKIIPIELDFDRFNQFEKQ